MAEAENVVQNYKVDGLEKDSIGVHKFTKDDETDFSEVTVTDSGKLGVLNIKEILKTVKYGPYNNGALSYNAKRDEEFDVEDGYNGLLECMKETFEEVYGEDGPYKYWGNPNPWAARGIIQECCNLYRDQQNFQANPVWFTDHYLKLFNAGHLLFTSVFPHVTGISMCMLNYNEQNKWTPNRGFYAQMMTPKEYYPLNFKANEEDGWHPKFYNDTHTGFCLQWPYTSSKDTYDDGGNVVGKEQVLCGDWILPQLMWHIDNGQELTRYPVTDKNVTADMTPEKFKVDKMKLVQTKFDFAGNIGYKFGMIKIGKELVDGHKDIYVMAEANKEIICAGKFREGIMMFNFATKTHPKGKGRPPLMNKANSYRCQQVFADLISKGFLTTFGGEDAVNDVYKN